MASILRSAKFVRYVVGFARNVVINPPREFDTTLIQNTTATCLCGGLQRSLATEASGQISQPDQSLERSIRRLDQDVRRSGRISRRDIEDILEEIRHSRSPTSSQSLLVIRCCGNLVPEELPETRTKLVQEIWNTLHRLNVPMDISHYNALLRVYLENEHPFSPTEFLSDLEAKGIEPNRVTYQRLISRYCQLGDIEGATRILEFMREKQLPVNENVFNALIMGHSQTDDMESANGILSVMQQAGLEPSADTYTTLTCGYARKGDIDTINSLLAECEAKEIYLLDKDYLDIIFALSTNNHNEHVPVILSKVRKSIGYNQDAINLILRLINHGQEETALEILKTMPTVPRMDHQHQQQQQQSQLNGVFLIRQLVKVKRPIEKIITICRYFEENGINPKALIMATEISLELGETETSYALLRELQKNGQNIRQHYFWPLLVDKGKKKNQKKLLDVLSTMNSFNLTPTSETIRDYVLPYLSEKEDQLIITLCNSGVSVGTAASSVIHKLLISNNIKDAASVGSKYKAYYSPSLLKKPLTTAYLRSNDLESYVRLIRAVYDNYERAEIFNQNEDGEETGSKYDKTDITGIFVYELMFVRPKNFVQHVEEVLHGLVEQGLSMSNNWAERIQERLGEKFTPEIASLLGKMTSSELTPVAIDATEPHYVPSSAMSIPQLERLISNLDAKGEQTKGLKRQLLSLYTRTKDLEKAESLLQRLTAGDFVYTSGVYAQLIDLYAHHEKIEETLTNYQKLLALEPGATLDDSKLIKVVSLLIKHERFDEAIGLLNKQNNADKIPDQSFGFNAMCWRMLNSLAEQGKAEQVTILFETLLKNKYIEPNNILLGPLVKVHLINNDLDKAMQAFESCCIQYKSTPWKNELACRLIQKEDAEKLQILTDLSTNVHGEVNSLYDLVFAFVECGRIRQARKILETPGLQSRPRRVSTVCERYREEGLVQSLEGLVEATKDISHINRADIYYQLLLSYIKNDNADKALGLWTQMQEEDVQPSDEFLQKLGTFLKNKNVNVPFVFSDNEPEMNHVVNTPRGIQSFRNLIKEGNVNEAYEMKSSISNQFNINDYSLLLEGLVREERFSNATKLCLEMLSRNLYPVPRVFRYYLNRVANNGDVNTIERIGSKLNSDMKKILSFDNRLCHANIVAGKGEEYLDVLLREIDNARDGQVEILSEKFPRGGAVGILEKCPELTEKYELLAEKYAKRNVIAPMNVLWAQHFINENTEAADRIWNGYLKDTPRIMFQRVVQLARETKNERLIRRLIEHLKYSKVSEGALGNAYSCLLDILVHLDKKEEVINEFEKVVQEFNLEHINRTAILRIKDLFNAAGKTFNYTIPVKNHKQISSSSDDEKSKQ